MSLLEKALSHRNGRSSRTLISDEHVELALSWATNEISGVQVAHALEHGGDISKSYALLANALKHAILTGKITINYDAIR